MHIKERTFSKSEFNDGVGRFIVGLGKKIIIANQANEFSKAFLIWIIQGYPFWVHG